MHPILSNSRRFALYLLAWIPLCGLIAFLLAPSPLSWLESFAVCIPLCLVYAFICLSAWYICRGIPIREGNLTGLLTTHALTAMIDAGLWVLLGRLIAGIIGIPAARMSGVATILFVSGILLYLLSVAIHYVVLAMEASRAAHKREDEARVLAGRAELRALRAQINPHFLYNSLNSISALTSIDPAKARDMCIQLSDFLRNTLGLSELSSIPLRQEMDLVRSYLAIERVRFGKRLTAGEQIPEECLPDLVPPLILQPLVENAIVHGIASVLEEGVLQLTAEHTADGKLRLVVENSFDPDAKQKRQTEFGLASIRKRLQVIYGHEASLKVSTVRDLFRVELAVPRT